MSHGEVPASLQDSRATTQALCLQGHLNPSAYPHVTEPFPNASGPAATTASGNATYASWQRGTRCQPRGAVLLPPPWRREKACTVMVGGHQGKSRSLAQRESPVAHWGGYVDCEFLFPTQAQILRPGVSAAELATVPVSPRLPAAAKLAGVPLQRDPGVSESSFKVMEESFFPGLWEGHFPRPILQKEETLDKLSLMHLSK